MRHRRDVANRPALRRCRKKAADENKRSACYRRKMGFHALIMIKKKQAWRDNSKGAFFALNLQDGCPARGLSLRKRVKGIEPSCPAWEAGVLPLNYTRRAMFDVRCLMFDLQAAKIISTSAFVQEMDIARNRNCPANRSLRKFGARPAGGRRFS